MARSAMMYAESLGVSIEDVRRASRHEDGYAYDHPYATTLDFVLTIDPHDSAALIAYARFHHRRLHRRWPEYFAEDGAPTEAFYALRNQLNEGHFSDPRSTKIPAGAL